MESKENLIERWLLRIAGAIGLAIFAAFFALTFAGPQWVEDFAAEYLESEVIKRVDAGIDAAVPPAGNDILSRAAAELYKNNEQEILQLKSELKTRSSALIGISLDAVRDPACKCRVRIAQAMQQFDGDIALNRGRVTTHLGNGLASVLGSAFALTPC